MTYVTRFVRFDIHQCMGPSVAALLDQVHDLVEQLWTLSSRVSDESVAREASDRAEAACGLIDVLRDGLTMESDAG